MEAEVRAKYPDSDVKLIRGGGGIFDVTCDGKLIYSKKKTEGQRFPKEGEITGLIAEVKG